MNKERGQGKIPRNGRSGESGKVQMVVGQGAVPKKSGAYSLAWIF